MGDKRKLSDIVGEVGKVYYKSGNGFRSGAEPLEQLYLTEVSQEGSRFSAKLDCGESVFRQYGFLQGLAVSGQTSQTGYSLRGAVTGQVISPGLPLEYKNWQFELAAEGEKSRTAKALLTADAVVLGTEGLAGKASWELLREDAWIAVRIEFQDEKGKPGILVHQCLEVFEAMFGVSADWSSFLPSGIAFRTEARIYGFSCAYAADGTYKVRQAAVDFGFGDAPAGMVSKAVPCTLDGIRFYMGMRMDASHELFGSICVNLHLFGQQILLLAEYPAYRIEVQVPFQLALSKVAGELGLALPEVMRDVRLETLFLETGLDFSDCRMLLRLTDVVKLVISGSVSFRVEQTDFVLENGVEGLEGSLGGLLSLYRDETRMTGFLMKASFRQGGLILQAQLIEKAEFVELFAALTGTEMNPGFSIALIRMEIEGAFADHFSLSRYRAAGELSVTDASVFGVPFAMRAGVSGDGQSSVFSGSFTLEDLFTVEASAAVKGSKTDWTFLFVLKKLRIVLSYDNAKRTVEGTIESDLLLEDCVTWFLSLLNPEDSYAPSGEWSFLKEINLKGLTVVYSHVAKEVSIGWKPSFSVPFCSFDRIAIVAGAAGVRFEATGEFLGETYGADRPLSWEPNNPPETTGKLLQVQYLLLSDSLSVTGLDPQDLQKSVSQVEAAITPETKPDSLALSEKAGYLAAVDCKIADMVECKLMYNDSAGLYGAYFKLYGEKAAGFAGLCAELSYGKVNDTTGMFHARFVPPDLKEFQLGTLSLALGSVDARIYTNGDFYIDIGFPQNRNFNASFALSYGAFTGRGGMYLTQGAYGAASLLPKVQGGYFDHVIGVGLGLRLELGKAFRAGILSASAMLVLQGILEGIYAVYEPMEKEKPSVPFYRLSAWVSLDGVLTGRVDFGIIGASVSLRIQTQLRLVMQACEQVCVSTEMTIQASARVKVLFVKVNFSFSIRYRAEFTFADAAPAPWKKNQALAAERTAGRDAMPVRLVLPLRGTKDKKRIRLTVVPVYGGKQGFYTSTLFLLADMENFAAIAELLMETLTVNHYLNQTGDMELFDGRRLFADAEFLDRLLAERAVLELSFPESEEAGETDGAFLPLPQYLIMSLVSVYADGAEDYLVSRLDEERMIDDGYMLQNEQYYEPTTEEKTAAARGAKAGEARSLQSQLWLDYWELLVKAVRAQKESAELSGKIFAGRSIGEEQTKELAGIANTFLLGGKRAVTVSEENGGVCVDSAWYLSGASQELNWKDKVVGYRYELKKTDPAPEWLSFADGEQRLVYMAEKSKIQSLLPAQEFPAGVFVQPLARSASWELQDAVSVIRMPFIKTSCCGYCHAGEGFVEGTVYRREDGTFADFGILLKLELLRVLGEPAMFRVTGYGDFESLEDYFTMEERPAAASVSLLYQGENGWQEWEHPSCYAVKGAGDTEGCVFAAAGMPEDFLAVLYDSFEEETTAFLGFDEQQCVLPVGRELEVLLAVHLETEGIWQSCMNSLCCGSQEQITVKPERRVYRQIVPQGSIRAHMSLDCTALSGSEEILSGILAGAAAELTDEDGVVLSHETQPFLDEAEVWQKHRYVIQFPYAKAYPEDTAGQGMDCYAWIAKKKTFCLSVFFLDFAGMRVGNRMELKFVPQYQDELISPAAWPGAGVTYTMQDGAFKLVYRGDGEEQEALDEVIRQLEQPDVTVSLCGNILEGETERKEEVLSFLKECKAKPEVSHCRIAAVPIRLFEDIQFVKVSCCLSMERDTALTAADVPEQVQRLSYQIPFTYTDEKEGTVRLRRDAGGEKGILFAGEKEVFLLTEKECWKARAADYFAQRRLPDVSGTFADGEETITLQSFSVKSAVETFLEDLAWLRLPEQLSRLYVDDKEGLLLKQQYEVCRQAAQALAGLLCPIFAEADKETVSAVRTYAAQLLAEGSVYRFEELLFYVQTGDSSLHSEEAWILEGYGIDPTYKISLPVFESDARLCGVVEARETAVDFKGAVFRAQGAYRKSRGEWFRAEGAEAVFPFYGEDRLKKPSDDAVSVPVLLGRDETEEGEILSFEICPKSGDILFIGQKQKEEAWGSRDAIPVFYHYVNQSLKLRAEDSKESRMELLSWMKRFAEALKSYEPKQPVKLTGTSVSFAADNGVFQKICAENQAVQGIAVQQEDGNFLALEQSGTEFCFPEAARPKEDAYIRLRITLCPQKAGGKEMQEQAGFAVLERPQKLETNIGAEVTEAFVQQSEEVRI